ncbi:hypothetical protein CR513_57080, partial [Mucuna pruriens]
MDRSMIDAASGGALMDKTPAAARHLISNMASNTQQFGIRGPSQSRMVNEVGTAANQRLENQLSELTSLVRQLAVGQHQPAMAAKVCGICTSVEHPTDMCPTLQETESDQPENVGAIGGFQYGKQPYQNRAFDNQQHGRQPFRPGPNQGPYATQQFGSAPNTYQRQAGYQQPTPQYQAPPFQQQQQQQRAPTQGNSPSLEDLMKQLATSNLEFQQSVSSSNLQFQQNMTATIQDLKMQIGQLANTVSQLQSAGSSNLPSQTIPNPRGNASVVTLRSGRELPQPTLQQLPRPAEADSEPNADLQSRPETTVPLPFPSRTTSARKPKSDEELLKMFRKVEINIPLLDAIKQVPRYAKFLKELSSTDPLHAFDPDIELTLRRLRKIRNAAVNTSRSIDSVADSNQSYTDSFVSSSNVFAEPGQMENNDRTLKELATPDVVYQPWCIQYRQLEPAQTYELKSGLIHLLPKFHGLAGEDPHKHLKEFHVVCSTMRPQGISEDYIKMKAFPFSLDGAAKDWLYLQPALFNTWGDMKRAFLEKFFPASRTATIRKEICGIRQHTGEILHEYWERFNKLCATCPHHQISEQLLIQYFYEGLSLMDRSMIDAASGGALMDKTPAAARHLISNMASNTQQFGIRGPNQPRMVNEIGAASNQRLENQLTELTSLVRQLAVGQHQPAMAAKVCGICTSVEHPTDMCPTLQETESDQPENVGAIVAWETAISGKIEPRAICSSTIRIHTEYLSEASRLSTADSTLPSTTFPTTAATAESAYTRQLSISGRPNEVACNQQPGFQQNMTATIQDLKTQIGQLANTVRQMQSVGSSNLPSQTIPNPRGNASVVTLRSGKELPQPTLQQLPRPAEADSEPNADLQSRPETTVPLPFPSRTTSARKLESDEELLKMFCKVEINIPLLDAIKQVPKYAKFLKELCVHKRRKIKGSKEIGGVVSALTKNEAITAGAPTLPKKCRDPGIFSVPCTIGECTFADAMLDLGASINVMPASIYRSLNFGDLEPTGMTIQLANRSIVQPLGVLEDVLVQVNELIFPTDFYVLDMKDETSGNESTLILGRPFLMTARTKIDVHAGILSMEFGDTLV